MDEKIFFNENGVSVSNVRFIAHGQTYAMSGVTAVKSFRKDPPRKAFIACAVIGVSWGLSVGVVFGLILLAIMALVWYFMKSEYSVMLSSASGENKALSSKDGAFILRVVDALNDSIVHRG